MSQSAVKKFIDSTRELFAAEADPAKRWAKMPPLLQELLADPSIKEQSKSWPDCSQGSERAENLLFYEDPDYKFVINGLIKAPKTRTQIHDHAHNWTLYGVLDGTETIERYERTDDRSDPDYADIRKTVNVQVGAGKIDLVPPYEIHAEESGARTDRCDYRPGGKSGNLSPRSLRSSDEEVLARLRPETTSLREIARKRCRGRFKTCPYAAFDQLHGESLWRL